MILPNASSPYVSHFLQAPNTIAGDEIEAHTGMFDGKTNDGYYELGLLAAQLVRDVMVASRSVAGGAAEVKSVAQQAPSEQNANVVTLADDPAADASSSMQAVAAADAKEHTVPVQSQ